ncbi:hypothetical protein EMCRGX_G010691 [Ephydatia muelleri]
MTMSAEKVIMSAEVTMSAEKVIMSAEKVAMSAEKRKVTMSAEKVTMSAEKVTMSAEKMTMSAEKVTMSAEKGDHECREGLNGMWFQPFRIASQKKFNAPGFGEKTSHVERQQKQTFDAELLPFAVVRHTGFTLSAPLIEGSGSGCGLFPSLGFDFGGECFTLLIWSSYLSQSPHISCIEVVSSYQFEIPSSGLTGVGSFSVTAHSVQLMVAS